MENLKYHVFYMYEFHSAADTTIRVNDLYGGRVAKENSLLLVPKLSFWKFGPVEKALWTAGDPS